MDNDFYRLSAAVMAYITSKGHGRETKRAYQRCFAGLSSHLDERGAVYSPEEAYAWLSTIKPRVSRTEYSLYCAALNKASDLMRYGEIRKGRYDPSKTIAGRLCPEFRQILDQFLVHICHRTDDTVSAHSWQCASILCRFQEHGASSAERITYGILLDEFNSSSGRTYYSRCAHHGSLRLLLQFLYDKGYAPYGFTLFVDAMTMGTGYFWNRIPEERIRELWAASQNRHRSGLDVFLEMKDALYLEHSKDKYSRTSLKGIIRITNLFYLFMDMNHLCYSPDVGDAWLGSVRPFLADIEYKHYRRVICLLAQHFNNEPRWLNSFFVFRETCYKRLPDWCRPEVDESLRMKKAEGWAVSTLRMYTASVCRFCISIDALGARSFRTLSALDVKRFNLSDSHRTPEGKNAYNSRIRKFLQFLGENHLSDNPFLFLALPCVSTAREALVVTLTKDEQAALRQAFREDDTRVRLREKAMLQLGLYMGIRQSDIAGLTIDDVDWDNISIRVSLVLAFVLVLETKYSISEVRCS